MSSKVLKECFLSKFVLWILFAAAGLYFVFPNLFIPGAKHKFDMSRLKLGIDLQGGTYITLGVEVEKAIDNLLASQATLLESFAKTKNVKVKPSKKEIKDGSMTLFFDSLEDAKVYNNFIKDDFKVLKPSMVNNDIKCVLMPAEANRVFNDSVEQAVSVISNRLNSLGVEGILVQRHGARQIVVQIPGVDDPVRVRELITRRAHLEFKLVIKSSSSVDDLLDAYDGDLPSDMMIVSERKKGDSQEYYLVSAFPDLTGEHIADARVKYGQYGEPTVGFNFDSTGAKIFNELTGNNIGKRLAIVIDNEVQVAPNIQSKIGAEGVITGNYSMKSAKDLSIVLKSGAFQAPVTYQEERRVGPSMGQDSINKGLLSCAVGLVLIFFFSLFYYKLAGLLAFFALVFNLFLILMFLSYFGATLTLPGIAGMVLTIGMAIDASILIYEKIKEELRDGTTYKQAINKGFRGAMVVILDSNITTFLTGLVLFYFGGPSIRGFAVTLMVGIVATVLAGVFFLRSLFEFLLGCVGIKKIWM